MSTGDFTIGVEEEFLVVDGATGALRPEGPALLPEARARLGDDVHRQRRVMGGADDQRAVVNFIVEETTPAAC
jgi:hypothetical protein